MGSAVAARGDGTMDGGARIDMPSDSTMLCGMAEAGGTSTQAGVRYQNSIAALHVGRMLDTRARSLRERVTTVRVEAPAHVDDIVVRHADGASRYIQAKLGVRQGDAAWDGLWRSLSRQLATIGDVDRLGIG